MTTNFMNRMTNKIFLALAALTIFTSMDCKDDPPVVPPPPPPYKQSIFLSVADSGLTEVYLKLTMTDTLPPRGYTVLRNNVQILSGSLFGKETTLVDTTAQRNTNYFYQAFRLENNTRKDSSSIVTTKTMDTTSHEFVWTEYTFGNWDSNVLRDIEIESDTLILAVGSISLRDTSGKSVKYNAARFKNNEWQTLRFLSDARILYPGSIGEDSLFVEGSTLKFNSENEFWLAAGNIHHITETSWTQERAEGAGFGTELWGYNNNTMWIVGALGTIIKYNGSQWQVQSSSTTVDLTDIWGTPDGSTLWACGYKSDNLRSVLLQYNNGTWQTLWSREGTTPVPPFDFRVTSLWYKKRLYLCNTSHVFTMKNGVATQISPSFGWLIHRIRGNDENDIAVVTEESAIWHFNGSNWKKVYQNANQRFRSVAMKGNTVVAVGYDVSTFPNKAVVVVGIRS